MTFFCCVFGRETVDIVALSSNIRIIAESIARQIYNLTEVDMPQLFTNGLVGLPFCIKSGFFLMIF